MYPIVPGNSLTRSPCGSSSRAVNVNPGQLCYWVIIPGKPWGSTREKKNEEEEKRGRRWWWWLCGPFGGWKKGGVEERRARANSRATGSILLNRLEKERRKFCKKKNFSFSSLSSLFSFYLFNCNLDLLILLAAAHHPIRCSPFDQFIFEIIPFLYPRISNVTFPSMMSNFNYGIEENNIIKMILKMFHERRC